MAWKILHVNILKTKLYKRNHLVTLWIFVSTNEEIWLDKMRKSDWIKWVISHFLKNYIVYRLKNTLYQLDMYIFPPATTFCRFSALKKITVGPRVTLIMQLKQNTWSHGRVPKPYWLFPNIRFFWKHSSYEHTNVRFGSENNRPIIWNNGKLSILLTLSRIWLRL